MFTIEGNTQPDRQTQGDAGDSTTSACRHRPQKASRRFGNGSSSTVPARVRSTASVPCAVSSFVTPTDSKAKSCSRSRPSSNDEGNRFQARAAAAARSPARLTSSVWMPGTAAMAPGESRVSGAPA